MPRRTISLPDDLAAEIDDVLASGDAPNVSAFFRDAARRHLVALRSERMVVEAARLDADEETALARASRPRRGRAPWGRLR